jgi:hypothetical protein
MIQCRNFGMSPVHFDSEEELKHFLLHFNMQHISSDNEYIIGLYHKKGFFYWAETARKVTYDLPWPLNEPNFADGKNRCVSIFCGQTNLTLKMMPCDDVKTSFICERS